MNSNWFMILQIKNSSIVIVKLYLLHVRLSNKFIHFPWVYESCATIVKNWRIDFLNYVPWKKVKIFYEKSHSINFKKLKIYVSIWLKNIEDN